MEEIQDKKVEAKPDTEVSNLTDWKNEPSVADLKQDLTDSQPDHSNQTARVRRWLDYLFVEGENNMATYVRSADTFKEA